MIKQFENREIPIKNHGISDTSRSLQSDASLQKTCEDACVKVNDSSRYQYKNACLFDCKSTQNDKVLNRVLTILTINIYFVVTVSPMHYITAKPSGNHCSSSGHGYITHTGTE